MRETALLMPDAIPTWRGSAALITAVVSGATVMPMPTPTHEQCRGRMQTRYDGSGSSSGEQHESGRNDCRPDGQHVRHAEALREGRRKTREEHDGTDAKGNIANRRLQRAIAVRLDHHERHFVEAAR